MCYIYEQTSHLPEMSAAELLRIREDEMLMGLVERNKIHSVRYASEVIEMLGQIERIIERIEVGLTGP